MTEEDQKAGWEAYKAECNKHGCKPIRAHLSPETGKAFCLTEASSADEVMAAHKESAKPSEPEVIEVQILD